MKKKRKNKSDLFVVLALVIGLILVLYPTVSDRINGARVKKSINEYESIVSNVDNSKEEKMIAEAEKYNAECVKQYFGDELTGSQLEKYNSVLDVTGTGIMGYVSIPCINVELPIYHTSEENVIQVAVGHLEWSSLPVGGKTSHCVISGHRGLPRARLFTDLDKLIEGDIFTIRVLSRTYYYQVDNISIVLPTDVSKISLEKGRDYVTLLTCTPYGINTHRLLVRGRRIENPEQIQMVRVMADATVLSPVVPTVILFVVFLAILEGVPIIMEKRSRKRNSSSKEK